MAVRDRRDYIPRGENERCTSQNTVARHHPGFERGGGAVSALSHPSSCYLFSGIFIDALLSSVIENTRFNFFLKDLPLPEGKQNFRFYKCNGQSFAYEIHVD